LDRGPAYRIGVFWSFISAFLWGTTFVGARFLLRDGRVDAVTLTMVRFLIGGGLLLGVGLLLYRKRVAAVTTRDLLWCALLGLLGVCAMSVLLFMGQRTTTAINGSMIMQICPLMILFGAVFIGERLRATQIAGALVALLGCLMVTGVVTTRGIEYRADHVTGDLLTLLSAACWAAYTVMAKPVVARLGGFTVTAWTLVFAAIETAVLWLLMPAPAVWPAGGEAWAVVLYMAIFPSGVAFFAWYEAMDRIELSLLNVMQYLTPVVTIVLAWALIGERLSWLNGAGVLLVLGGVLLTHERAPARG
jgi:drug/metabolite transporter (DMT)-like permease